MDISLVVAFAAGLLIGYFVYVLAHNSGKVDLNQLRDEALTFVAAAEKLLPGKTGAEKLDYVFGMLKQTGMFNRVDPTVARAAVEWAVSVWKRDQAAVLPLEIVGTVDKYTEHGAVSDGSI